MTVAFDVKARQYMFDNYQSVPYDGTPVKLMEVKRISTKEARKYIASFHYSHTMPDSTRFAYGGYLNGELCGVICYGMGCGKSQYTSLIPDIENGSYVELTRLWCKDDYPKNTESKLISGSLKLLPKEIKLVVSYADKSQGHCGIIYQATNWLYCGKTNGGKMLLMENGLKKHVRLLGIYRMRHKEYKEFTNKQLMKHLGYIYVEAGQKYRYVYLRGTKQERRKMLNQIKGKIRPYPKLKKKEMIKDHDMLNSIKAE